VVLRGEGEELELTIIDSGVGFDVTLRQPGLGLHSMRERVGLIRGRITIDSLPGEGTRVVVRAPVLQKEQDLPG
jgi:signal transduction histidine kinase